MAAAKNQRQIEVYRAMTMLKRGRPADVIRMVAPLLNQDSNDAAFKRAVHRDLKSLMFSNQIGADYYTPSGDLIPAGEEDQHQNVRVEYYMLSHMDQEITGFQRYHEMGGGLIAKPILNSVLKFSESLDTIPVNTYRLSIEMRTGFYIHLWFSVEDRPLQFILARTSKEIEQQSVKEQVVKKLDNRSVVLLLPNKSISRLKLEDLTGHSTIDFSKREGEVMLTDHGSHNGSFKVYADKIKETFMNFYIADQTVDGNYQNLMWGKVDKTLSIELPNLIRVGSNLIFIDQV